MYLYSMISFIDENGKTNPIAKLHDSKCQGDLSDVSAVTIMIRWKVLSLTANNLSQTLSDDLVSFWGRCRMDPHCSNFLITGQIFVQGFQQRTSSYELSNGRINK